VEICIGTEGARYDVELALARCAEDCGFAGYFRADHLMRAGTDDPAALATDVWVSMAGLARETQRLRLGSVMTCSTFRHPAHLAIIVAQVDAMSGGRIELGIGAGSSPAEHAALGIQLDDIGTRFDRVEEQLELIKAIWSTPLDEDLDFDGDHYRVEGYPARVELSPSPPIIIGGHGPKRTPRLAARFADEFNIDWLTPEQAAAAYERVDRACEAVGRDPKDLARSVSLVLCCATSDRELERRLEATRCGMGEDEEDAIDVGAVGSPQQVVDCLGEFSEVGVSRVYLEVYDMTDLDQLALVGQEVLPHLVAPGN
jgi:alkanesulfonate monooxygenase SsuD/methylene tetrahydromethanopterin reductase-like flavin-dependent oxidoreductase (luciferase family)